MRNVVFPICLLLISGCGNPFQFDPATTVILKVTGVEDGTESERIEEECVELVIEQSTWQKHQVFRTGDRMTIKLSPVEDPKQFADRIEFGEVTAIEDNMVHVKVGGQEAEGIEVANEGKKDN